MTLSLGVSRLFRLKNCDTGEVVDIKLQPGSVFQLGPKTNEKWKHSIVKCSMNEVSETRISITFRSIATMHKPGEEEAKEEVEEEEEEAPKRKKEEQQSNPPMKKKKKD